MKPACGDRKNRLGDFIQTCDRQYIEQYGASIPAASYWGMAGNDVIFSRKKTDSSSRPKKNQFIIFQQKMKGIMNQSFPLPSFLPFQVHILSP